MNPNNTERLPMKSSKLARLAAQVLEIMEEHKDYSGLSADEKMMVLSCTVTVQQAAVQNGVYLLAVKASMQTMIENMTPKG